VITPVARDRAVDAAAVSPVSVATTAMGGRLAIHLAAERDDLRALHDGRQILARIDRWAERLSRHLDGSELSTLNDDPNWTVSIRPTLGAALWAGLDARDASEGLVDITLLDARLAAEGLIPAARPTGAHRWSVQFGPGRGAIVQRQPGVRFDLGGVAKGWLADRALDLLARWTGVVVDADGDLAVRCAVGGQWTIAIDDPRADNASLAVLNLSTPAGNLPARWGIATSGTSVHRWGVSGSVRHHLIDPRTGISAVTDVVQATVVSGSTLRAEALAKAAVIAGSAEGLALLERAGVAGAILLTDRDEVLALPSTLALLDPPGDA
jgi:thiamine biosynthesis lipoprotein